MTDAVNFEARLADAFERYVEPAPVDVNAAELARAIARVPSRRPFIGAAPGGAFAGAWRASGLLRALVVAGLLVVVLIGSLIIGSGWLDVTPVPSSIPAPLRTPPTAPSLSSSVAPTMTMEVREPTPPIAALLRNGDVLVVHSGTAERWLAGLGAFAMEAAPLSTHQSGLIASLPDGRVLVIGGQGEGFGSVSGDSVEVYDPVSERFVRVSAASIVERSGCACGLSDRFSRVRLTPTRSGAFLAGGTQSRGGSPVPVDVADVFDAATDSFSEIEIGCAARVGTQATLTDGRVLVTCFLISGQKNPARLFDPSTGTFSSAASENGSNSGLLTPLRDGRALLTGPATSQSQPELYDPRRDAWDTVDTGLNPPFGTPAVVLADGRVLFAGGNTAATYLFDPASNTMTTGPIMPLPAPFTMVVLSDRRVLVLGTDGNAAIFDPGA